MIYRHNCNMFLLSLILVSVLVLGVRAQPHPDFPQWDTMHWVVKSTDHVRLECSHPTHFPFNDTVKLAKKVVWILPAHISYQHLSPGNKTEGWSALPMDQNYALSIDRMGMNLPEAVNGMYLCAVLAEVGAAEDGTKVYSWFYLRWGVGLYTNVPAMKEGTIGERYYWCFTYAWVSCLVTIVLIVLFSLTVHFHYKGGPVETSDEISEVGIDGLSIEENKKPYRPGSTPSSTIRRKKGLVVEEDDIYGKM